MDSFKHDIQFDCIGHYYPSMAQDILMFKRQTEVVAMTETLSNYGKELGIANPCSERQRTGSQFCRNILTNHGG